MPNRVQWDSNFSVGNDLLDDQHRQLLAQCNLLADHCGPGEGGHRQFTQVFDALMAFAREHFKTEASLLTGCGYPDLEDYRHECEEYEYLATEIVTTENFDPLELQRFLALWWVGHIMGAAKQQRTYLRRQQPG